MDFTTVSILVVVALVVGFAAGALVMRNNYKSLMKSSDDARKVILDARMTAEQKLLHIRNKFGV